MTAETTVAMLPPRIASKIDASGDCWLWTAAKNPGGYAIVGAGGSRCALAHRFVYELLVGPIPVGLVIDHLCRVRHCVRPDHLEAVTNATNVRRADLTPQGARNRAKTHCPKGHPYTPENTYRYRKSAGTWHRQCRTCHRAIEQRRRSA